MPGDQFVFQPGLLRGQCLPVTGGGTGLGRVEADACLALDAEVFLCGRRGPVAEPAAHQMMQASGGNLSHLARWTAADWQQARALRAESA